MAYEYAPFDPSQPQIRLLRLHPGSGASIISGNLVRASLDDKPYYEALSYCWGDAKDQKLVTIDGKDLSITTNLHIALRYLRNEENERTLWIDAVCVNQKDIAERSKQVQKMGEIFKSATRVLAWLGDSQDLEGSAIETVMGYKKSRDTEGSLFDLRYGAATEWITSRPYWSRTWIVQELAISRNDPLVGCGTSWAPLSGLCRMTDKVKDRIGLRNFSINYTRMQSLLHVRELFQNRGGGIAFLELINFTCHCSCSDSKDMVYGILGLATDFDRENILPDYSLSPNQLGVALAKYFIDCRKDLRILSMHYLGFGSSIPSWAPKFEDTSKAYTVISSLATFIDLSVSEHLAIDVRFCSDLQTMSIQGQPIERIEEVAIHLPGTDDFLSSILSPIEIIARALQTAASSSGFVRPLSDNPLYQLFCLILGYINPSLFTSSTGENPCEDDLWVFRAFVDKSTVPDEFKLCNLYKNWDWAKAVWEQALYKRCFFTTASGLIGVGPFRARKGDVICTFDGGNVFYVLRPTDNYYQYIGDAYIHDFMDGDKERIRSSIKGWEPVSQRFNIR
jgi:hypothetical protein